MLEITIDNFDREVLQADRAVVIDFWAPWCGPCKQLLPVIEGFAERFKDQIKIVKCNVTEYPELAERFAVKGIPALLSFKEGSLNNTRVGASQFGLEEWIRAQQN